MNCCPNAEFTLLENGLQVRELNTQDNSTTVQFFPYRAIQSVRYTYNRDDRESWISLWVLAHGTPGAGGISYRYFFPCGDAARSKYEELLGRL